MKGEGMRKALLLFLGLLVAILVAGCAQLSHLF